MLKPGLTRLPARVHASKQRLAIVKLRLCSCTAPIFTLLWDELREFEKLGSRCRASVNHREQARG